MGSEGPTNATWKAVSTLEWKQKQRRPAASVPKGVGAILGEAADMVAGKYASGGGPASSPYLNRLSEIQIQDEAYIHQQLVKEEVKPKRPAPHRLFIGKGSRSSRGLKLSASRKVRFNDGAAAADGGSSPTHKTAVVATAATAAGGAAGPKTAHSPTSVAAAAAAGGRGRAVRFGRSSSGSDSGNSPSPPPPPAAVAAAKAGRRAGSVSFPAPSNNSSDAAGSSPPQQVPSASAVKEQQPQQQAAAAAQRSPSPLPQQQQQQATRYQPAPPSSSQLSTGDAAIMAQFLQQQPVGLEASPAGTGSGGLDLTAAQLAERRSSGATAGPRTERRTTDLVDKQLQWLRGSSDGPNSMNTTASSATLQGSNSNASSNSNANSSSSSQAVDFTLTMGYRPIAIPQELFDRWSNMGGGKPAAAAAAAATPVPAVGNTAQGGASNGSSGSASLASKAAARRTTGSFEAPPSTAAGSGLRHNAGSPPGSSSRPSSGQEAVPHTAMRDALASGSAPGVVGGAGWAQQQQQYVLPARRLSATNAAEGSGQVKHSLPARQRTADASTLHTLMDSIKPPNSNTGSSKPSRTASVPGAQFAPGPLAPARSLPSSGRVSPAMEPTSPEGQQASSSSGSSSSSVQHQQQQQQQRCSSIDRLTRFQGASNSSSSDGSGSGCAGAGAGRAARAAAALASAAFAAGRASPEPRRGSRATGSSTSSSHGDAEWELAAGRREGCYMGGSSGSSNISSQQHTRPAVQAAAPPSGSLGLRHGSVTGGLGGGGSSGGGGSKVHLPEIGAKKAHL